MHVFLAGSASNADLRARGTRNLMDAAHGAGVGRVISQSIAWAYAAGCEPTAEEIPRFPSWHQGFHAMRPASPASKASR